MDKKKTYALSIISGFTLVVLGFIYQILNLSGGIVSLIFLNAGLIIMVVAVLKYNRYGAGVSQDEMTREISSRALSYSWLLTFIFVNVIFWIDYLEIYKFQVQPLLGIIIFLMPISTVIFKKLIFAGKVGADKNENNE